MASVSSFLVRGLLAGLVAGLLAFAVGYVVGEPSLEAAIALEAAGGAEHRHAEVSEEAGAGHPAAVERTEVPRSLQSTAGLLTATAVTGVTLGGLVGVLSALAFGRFGRLGVRGTTLLVAAVGFLSLYAVPFAAYPPNPPAVGRGETIGIRTGLYFLLLAISVIAAVTAVLVGRHLAARWGAWSATVAVVGGWLVVVVAVIALMPSYDEVPAGFPAPLLYDFRAASVLTQLTLWTVLGVTLAELTARLTRRPGRPAPLVDATV